MVQFIRDNLPKFLFCHCVFCFILILSQKVYLPRKSTLQMIVGNLKECIYLAYFSARNCIKSFSLFYLHLQINNKILKGKPRLIVRLYQCFFYVFLSKIFNELRNTVFNKSCFNM